MKANKQKSKVGELTTSHQFGVVLRVDTPSKYENPYKSHIYINFGRPILFLKHVDMIYDNWWQYEIPSETIPNGYQILKNVQN